jgi:hypothetical protein
MHMVRTALKKSVQPSSSITKPIRYEKLLQKQQSYENVSKMIIGITIGITKTYSSTFNRN